MNWDQVEGKWKQMKGEVKTRWGKLTDDDLQTVGGQKEKLIGSIQERYGIQKDEAQRQVDEWHRSQDKQNEVERDKYRKAG
jgi:uncharacterized protein YjbJ (UPF0337 family)